MEITKGLDLFVYLVGSVSARAGASGPVQVDVRHGTPLRWFCPSNDGFVADAIAYLRRLQRETGVDGFMSDEIGFRPESCGCQHCRAGFERDTGYRLPEDAGSPTLNNPDDPLWRLWLKWYSISLNRFQQKVIAELSRHWFSSPSSSTISSRGLTKSTRRTSICKVSWR